ncbi:MAG: LamG domain-containing protein [Clostridia bacterium]|nr:LamG domain-containing protein [Clostridia bacterium]
MKMKKIIAFAVTALMLLSLLPFAAFADEDVAAPVAWYDFEDAENLGKDKSGNGNDLLVMGQPEQDDSGATGKGVFLDGVSSLYAKENGDKMDFFDLLAKNGKEITIAFWVQHETSDYDNFDTATWRRIVSNGHDGGAVQDDTGTAFGGFTIIDLADNYIIPNAVITYMMNDSGSSHGQINPGTNYPYREGQWEFMTYTLNIETGEIDYRLNGVSILEDYQKKGNVGSGMRLYNTARPFSIGGNTFYDAESGQMAPNHMFTGSLDEVMIFDKVLTDAEIAYYMELTGKDVEVVTEPPATNPPATEPGTDKPKDTKKTDETQKPVDTKDAGTKPADSEKVSEGLPTGAMIGIIAAAVVIVAAAIAIILKKKK